MRDADEHFSDNIMVVRRRDRGDFLAVQFKQPDEYSRWQVAIYRYCVPGRCDIYHFDWTPGSTGVGDRVSYFSDFDSSMAEALKLLQDDLNKPQVVEMLAKACSMRRWRGSIRVLVDELLACLGPKTKAYRACQKTRAEMMAEVDKEIAVRRAAREAASKP